jgi:hypothetical protein
MVPAMRVKRNRFLADELRCIAVRACYAELLPSVAHRGHHLQSEFLRMVGILKPYQDYWVEKSRLFVQLSHAPAERGVKRQRHEKAVAAYFGFTPQEASVRN